MLIFVLQNCIEVRIKSTKGPIDVYLCEVEQENPGAKTFEDMGTLTSETKSAVPLDEGNKRSKIY